MVQHDFENNLCGLIKNSEAFKWLLRKGVALIEATGNSTKLICGYSIHVSSATINCQFFLAFRRVLSYRKKGRSLLLINILETLVMQKTIARPFTRFLKKKKCAMADLFK